MSISEYGDLTPRELLFIAEAYNEQKQLNRENMLTQAYLTAMWQRSKRMPTLEKVLEGSGVPKQTKEQTPEEMFAFLKGVHRKLTGEGE